MVTEIAKIGDLVTYVTTEDGVRTKRAGRVLSISGNVATLSGDTPRDVDIRRLKVMTAARS